MTRTEIKALLGTAAQTSQDASSEAQWTPDGVETLDFEDPRSVDSGGSCTMYGDSGVVRLEIYLPPHRAAEVIEYVVRGERLSPVRASEPVQGTETYTVNVLATPAVLHTSGYVMTGRISCAEPNVGQVPRTTLEVDSEDLSMTMTNGRFRGAVADGSPLGLELADLIAAQTLDLAQGPAVSSETIGE